MSARPASPAPVAYLTGHYPKASHTFILREIAALERRGIPVLRWSLRRPAQAELIGPEERAEAARCGYLVERAARAPHRLVLAHLALAARAPGRYLHAAGLAARSARPGLRGALWALFHFAEAGLLARSLGAAGARHLHNHFADTSATVAMLAAALAALPFSYTLHGPAELYEPEGNALALKTARARFVACISHYARAQAMLFSAPGHWDRLHIVHCGVDPALYDTPAPPARAGLRLLFVGRLAAIKGLRVLIEALSRARAGGGDGGAITLDLVGDGPDRAALEAAARPLDGAVRFLGYRSQAGVAAALAEADALVLPSFAEGLPVVLMEAMASRRPVIATRVGGVGELVEDGVSGLLVEAGDAAGLAGAIAALAADPARRAGMGAAGRARVLAAFDAETEAARIAGLIGPAAGAGG